MYVDNYYITPYDMMRVCNPSIKCIRYKTDRSEPRYAWKVLIFPRLNVHDGQIGDTTGINGISCVLPRFLQMNYLAHYFHETY